MGFVTARTVLMTGLHSVYRRLSSSRRDHPPRVDLAHAPIAMSRIPTIDEYRSLRDELVPIMQEIHNKGSNAFWNIALYYFIGDTLKATITDIKNSEVGYDDVARKELMRWGRPERVNRNAFDNLIEICWYATGIHRKMTPEKALVHCETVLRKAILFSLLASRYVLRRRKSGAKKREMLNRIAESTNDELVAAAVRQMTVHLVEDFDFYALPQICYFRPLDARRMKNGLAVSFATFGERGGITRLQQHGAFYGETYSKGSVIETNLPTFFHTWGWAYASHHVPSPSRQLDAFAQNFSRLARTPTDMLVILPTYVDEEHVQILADIWPTLRSIAADTNLRLTLRPRPRKVAIAGEAEKDWIRSRLSDSSMTFCSHRDLESALAVASMAICLSHPATSFLQCLKVKVPVLAQASRRDNYLPEYLPFLLGLEQLGVLHGCAESLLNAVSDVALDPCEWWSRISVDRRMVDYVANFCGQKSGTHK